MDRSAPVHFDAGIDPTGRPGVDTAAYCLDTTEPSNGCLWRFIANIFASWWQTHYMNRLLTTHINSRDSFYTLFIDHMTLCVCIVTNYQNTL